MVSLHTKGGWRYDTVDSVIQHIDHIVRQQKLTFVEEQVVLSWLQCNLFFEMGRVSTRSFLENMAEAEEEKMPVRGELYR